MFLGVLWSKCKFAEDFMSLLLIVFSFGFFFPSMCRMQVLEAIGRSPFLVGMHYAFQTESKLYLILGMFNVHP